MDDTDAATLEGTGPGFELARQLDVRARTRRAVHLIAGQITPGMSEEEASALARSTLSELGLRRGWHRIIVRCGANTTKDFAERSAKGVVLGDDDIFFIDIGPVFDGFEGDAGDTFVLGGDPGHVKARHDVRRIWEAVRERWLTERSTGVELYEFAVATTEALGWKLNLGLSGHRLSDYPHAVHYGGVLADVGFTPSPDLWVLEIAIVDPAMRFGAFYEDLLLEDQSLPEGTIP